MKNIYAGDFFVATDERYNLTHDDSKYWQCQVSYEKIEPKKKAH